MELYQLCSGRSEYAKVLTEIVRSRIVPSYVPTHDVEDASNVLLKTRVLRYRSQKFTLPTPCSLEVLVGVVRGILDDVGESMIRLDKFDLEWVGSELVFVPTLRHRFACVLTTPSGSHESVCLELDEFYAKISEAFDVLVGDMEEIPEELGDFLGESVFVASVYDLRRQRFVRVPMEDIYSNWVTNNCV